MAVWNKRLAFYSIYLGYQILSDLRIEQIYPQTKTFPDLLANMDKERPGTTFLFHLW